MYQEYIEREVVRETEKAYLVKQEVDNRRDGRKTNLKWVPKCKCRPLSEERQALYDSIPDELKQFVPKRVNVPEWIVGNGVW